MSDEYSEMRVSRQRRPMAVYDDGRRTLDVEAAISEMAELDESLRRGADVPGTAPSIGLQALVDMGVLSEDDISAVLADDDSLPHDARAAILRLAAAHGSPTGAQAKSSATFHTITADVWRVEMVRPDGRHELPLDAVAATDPGIPTAAILGLLEKLGTDDWTLTHVSEDRGIDENADQSFVIAARYLLRRASV